MELSDLKREKLERRSLRFTKSEWDALGKIADEQGVSRSMVIRFACLKYVNESGNKGG